MTLGSTVKYRIPLGGCLNRLPALLLVLLIFEYWALSFLNLQYEVLF